MQALEPSVEQGAALIRGALALVCEVISRPSESVYSGDMAAHRARDEERSDGKVLVVPARLVHARRVGSLEIRRPWAGSYHSVSGRFDR